MKKNIALLIVAAQTFVSYATLERATPESQGVSSHGIIKFVEACDKMGTFHSFVLLRHGKLIAEGWWKPYAPEMTHMLYSHSKSFIATGIGFLVDEGKIDLDERVLNIFPEYDKPSTDPKFKQLRIRDLLTMNIGSSSDHIAHSDKNWVERFFSKKIKHDPGTKFKYDSDATYLLSAIIERKTSKKTMDFLNEKLFSKIGITKAWTTYSPQGIACGGWGMNMTTHEMARFGQFYLQEGSWNGKQLLSKDFVRLASSRQTWSGWINVGARAIGTGTDWEQGYGFQFWRCRPDGVYRADGAFGQFTAVMPHQDAVLSVTAGLNDMQKELNIAWENLLPAMSDKPLPEDKASQTKLEKLCSSLGLPKVEGKASGNESAYGTYSVGKGGKHGRFNFTKVTLSRAANGWTIALDGECGVQTIPVGGKDWQYGSIKLQNIDYEPLGGIIGIQPTAATGGWTAADRFEAQVYLVGTPGHLNFKFHFNKGALKFNYHYWGMSASSAELDCERVK